MSEVQIPSWPNLTTYKHSISFANGPPLVLASGFSNLSSLTTSLP